MSGFDEIDAIQLHTRLLKNGPLLVDVRNDDEASRGMIEGARHIPLHLLPVCFEELMGHEPLVFYCHAGVRSAQACAFMASKGRRHLSSLRGGIIAWTHAGYLLGPKK